MIATALSDIAASEEQFQLATYKKMQIAAERGDGVWIYTTDGEKYLDLYGGHAVAGTGHCHPHVVKAIREQAGQLLFYSNLVYSRARARAACEMADLLVDARTLDASLLSKIRPKALGAVAADAVAAEELRTRERAGVVLGGGRSGGGRLGAGDRLAVRASVAASSTG